MSRTHPWNRDARSWRDEFSIPPDVTYLNHGSFGPAPRVVQAAREQWSRALESQPMDFFLRKMEEHMEVALARLGEFVGAPSKDLIFVDNATFGMNIVAASVALSPDDEVVLTNHEYGAVTRIWRLACERAGARLVIAPLPDPLVDQSEIAAAVLAATSGRTKLIVISHVTSPTAVVLPVELVCAQARKRGIPVCIDGPHALAMRELNLAALGCDYYTASCHKWLSAPLGSGFLYVAPRRQANIRPAVTSWGGSIGGHPASWKDEFNWSGTRDPAAWLSVPAAIEFLESAELARFRDESHALARYAREKITALTGLDALVPDSPEWYGSMIACPLPPLANPPQPPARDPLQELLWKEHKIEIAMPNWHGRRLLRVSAHLYTRREDIDKLVDALAAHLI